MNELRMREISARASYVLQMSLAQIVRDLANDTPDLLTALAEANARIAALEGQLKGAEGRARLTDAVLKAARKMPRATPAPGGAGTAIRKMGETR